MEWSCLAGVERVGRRARQLLGIVASLALLSLVGPAAATAQASQNGCCSFEQGASCNNSACLNCVMQFSPMCATGDWTPGCAEAANGPCSPVCGCSITPSTQDCCEHGSGPACNDPSCMNCVCGEDPICCQVAWDAKCADRALGGCWQNCACANDPSSVTGCGFPNACAGPAVPSANGCQPVPSGINSNTAACVSGAPWDLETCLAGQSGSQQVLFVGPSAGGNPVGTPEAPFPSVVQAVEFAKAGDTVCVAAGTYTETVTITKSIRLVGVCPTTTRFVKASIRVVGTQGVELINLGVSLSTQGGVAIVGSSYTSIKNCLLERNTPANLLVHKSQPNKPVSNQPSICGCGPRRNLDLCRLTLRWAGNGGSGMRVKDVDDVRLLQITAEGNAGPGILTDADAIRIVGSRIRNNRVGVVIRNPLETVLVQNNEITNNSQGGAVGLRSLTSAPAVTFRIESNVLADNGGWGGALVDSTGTSPPLYGVMLRNSVTRNRRVGLLGSGILADVLDNNVSRTYIAVGMDEMTSGRGVELLSPADGSQVQGNTISLNASGGLLIAVPDAIDSAGTEVVTVAANAITSNVLYGAVLSAPDPDNPPAFICPVVGGIPSCPAISLAGNTATANGGTGFYVQSATVQVDSASNTWGNSGQLSQPVGTFRYAAVLDRSLFSLDGDTYTSLVQPSALVLIDAAQGGASVGINTYVGAGAAPEVGLNSGSVSSLGVPINVNALENVALPMPCPLYPLTPIIEKGLISSL